jgi:hypothetical protein
MRGTTLKFSVFTYLSDRKGLLLVSELFRVCSLVQKSGGKKCDFKV